MMGGAKDIWYICLRKESVIFFTRMASTTPILFRIWDEFSFFFPFWRDTLCILEFDWLLSQETSISNIRFEGGGRRERDSSLWVEVAETFGFLSDPIPVFWPGSVLFLREKVFYDIYTRGPKLFGILDLFFGNERVRYALLPRPPDW